MAARSCAVCGAALPARTGRGRPRRYCGPGCKSHARNAARREARRRWWQEHFPGIAPITHVAPDLTSMEEMNEALAGAAHAERSLLLSHVPAELHDDVRQSDPADAHSDLFALLHDGAVRIRRDGPLAFAQRYEDGEPVGGVGMLVHVDGQWRWIDTPGE